MKTYKYFHRKYNLTTIGIVKARNKEEALEIIKNCYDSDFASFCELTEIQFDSIREIYYGA